MTTTLFTPGLGADQGRVEIGPEGGVQQLLHPGRAGYLARPWQPRSATVDGVTSAWTVVSRHDDDDEVEVQYSFDGDPTLRLTVRHVVAPRWSERWMLERLGPPDPQAEPMSVDALVVDLSPATDVVGWGLAAGAEARFALLPASGTGAVLAATLQSGSVTRFGPGTVRIDTVSLTPGSRYVVSWLLGWHRSAYDFRRTLQTVLPDSMTLRVGQVWELPAHPDAAVLVQPAVSVTTAEDGRTQIVGELPGGHEIEIRSASGTVVVDIAWAPEFGEVVTEWAGEFLQRRGTLLDSAEAVVVQAVVGADPDAGAALERYTGENDPDDVFSQIVVAREAVRGADRGLLRVAATSLGQLSTSTPGYGLAAAQTAITEVVAGQTPTASLPTAPDPAPVSSLLSCGQALERALLDPRLRDQRQPLLAAVGAQLGAGLAGSRLLPAPDDEIAYLVAVLGLVPDELASACEQQWGCSVPVLAERTRDTLLVDPDLSPAALAWLVVCDTAS